MSMPESPLKPALGFLTVISDPQAGFFGGYLVLNWAGRPLEFHCTAPIKPNRAQQILYGPTLEPYLYGEQIGRALVRKTQHAPSLICTDVPAALALRPYVEWPVVLVLSSPVPGAVPTQTDQVLRPRLGTDFAPPSSGSMGWKPESGPDGLKTPYLGRMQDSANLGENAPGSMLLTQSSSQDSAPLPTRTWRLDPPHPGIGPLLGFCWGRQPLAVLENLQQDYCCVRDALASLDESFDLAEPFTRIRDAIEEARRGG